MKAIYIFLSFCLIGLTGVASAEDKNLWGGAVAQEYKYKPQKVVYDVNLSSVAAMTGVLDRASHLSKITGADPFDGSIVLVLHGHEINYFARKNYQKYKELVDRAQSLVSGEVLTMKMCKLAAEGQGYKADDIHGFIKIVPMGDAEIIRLQNEEHHAYMQ